MTGLHDNNVTRSQAREVSPPRRNSFTEWGKDAMMILRDHGITGSQLHALIRSRGTHALTRSRSHTRAFTFLGSHTRFTKNSPFSFPCFWTHVTLLFCSIMRQRFNISVNGKCFKCRFWIWFESQHLSSIFVLIWNLLFANYWSLITLELYYSIVRLHNLDIFLDTIPQIEYSSDINKVKKCVIIVYKFSSPRTLSEAVGSKNA